MQTFVVTGQYVDSYAFREYPSLTTNQRVHQGIVPSFQSDTIAGLRRCELCHELLAKWDEALDNLVISRRTLDFGVTYDGITVVSHRFKSAYDSKEMAGLNFRELPCDQSFFAVNATIVVPFDAKRRKTRFINACRRCGNFESVVGATPVFLMCGTEIGEWQFVRTDLEFGTRDEKSPLLICGSAAADALMDANLNELDLIPIAATS